MENLVMRKKLNSTLKTELLDSFSEVLQHALIKKFKKIPSAEFVANEFNKHSKHEFAIGRETVRRWLNGQSIPDLDRILVIQKWLGIDLNGFGKDGGDQNQANRFASGLLPPEPHFERIKQRHIYDIEQLSHELHDVVDNFLRRLR